MSRIPLPYVPDWISGEVEVALGAISGQHVRRKRNTVLHLAQARAQDLPIRPVFRREDTCSEQTWYKQGGWASDAAIQEALRLATARAQRWEDTKLARKLQEASEILVTSAPKAAKELVRQIEEGERDTDRREASKTVLDRAGLETAPKQSQRHEVGGELDALIEKIYGDSEQQNK